MTLLMTFPTEARADSCGCRSLLMASAAGLSAACFAMVSVGLVYMHSGGDAWSSSNQGRFGWPLHQSCFMRAVWMVAGGHEHHGMRSEFM